MTTELRPWYAVATPHEDIRQGKLEEAVFAANIWAVVQETAPEVYRDPEQFFRKTYMTVGLAAILSRVAAALRGDADSGDRIISLQTAFGGGKTHTLVALWHLSKHARRLKDSPAAQELSRAIDGRFPENIHGIAVFTNATCDATQGRQTPEGIRTRTLWGELALQLGGPALYEKVRANDETQRVPQGLFVEVLRQATPCLILLDELADYCVGAAAVNVGDTSLADQTISFIQQLTEAVQQVPGAVVVATLPASKYEVAQSEKGQEAFVTLEKRFQRLGADVKPVADDEIYEVVRARLFESITPPDELDYPKKVAQVYQKMYAAHANEVPMEATKDAYRTQIQRAYPFHPLLIDALYTRWGSHPDLQRTRGVLRLLASIVGDLWQHRSGNTQTQHLIQPCHVNWTINAVQAALTRLWGPAYQSVAAADILGNRSNAGLFDDERGGDYQRERIGQGIAATILLGSFGGKGEKSGFNSKDIKLAVSRHGVNWNYTDGAILELEERCFYLHSTSAGNLGKRYWFGTKPTLNKLVVQYRQQYSTETFEEAILEDLRVQSQKPSQGGATWRTIVDPGVDLAEQRQLTLLILSPKYTWDEKNGNSTLQELIFSISARCGTKDRLYRNTLLFLAPTTRGLNKLRQAHRERAALETVKQDYWDQLDNEQREDLKKRLENAQKASLESLGPAYTVALRVFQQSLESSLLSDARTSFPEHLGYLWNTLVEDEEWILRRVGSVTLQKTGLVLKEGGLLVKDAIDAFLRFSDKPMIANKEAVVEGLLQACRDGLIGIGRGGSLSTLQARYCKKDIQFDSNEDGVWIIPPFEPQPETPPSTPGTSTNTPGDSYTPTPGSGGTTPPPPGGTGTVDKPQTKAKKVHRLVVRGSVPIENYGELFRCFLGPTTSMNLKKLNIGIQFEMEPNPEANLSASDAKVKSMQESARQLGLSFEIEEQ